jgi:hypothetical protein
MPTINSLRNGAMSEKELHREQSILDARMEYGLLLSTYTSLAQMMWLGYGAFFTLNTLMVTGLGFSYSDGAKVLDAWLLQLVHVAIPLIGIVISIISIYAAIEIRRMLALTNKRGRELEELLLARMFSRTEAYSRKKPVATVVGSFLFMLLWVSVLFAAVV